MAQEKTAHTPIPGFSGYAIDRDGNVYSIAHNWRGYGVRRMVPHPNDDGYPSVRLTTNSKRKLVTVHSLVAITFLPLRPSLAHEVRHLDGNKANSSVHNLAWGTRKENADDRERHGRTSRGLKHSAAIRASSHADAVRASYRAQKAASNV
jgi:hypothetical protein